MADILSQKEIDVLLDVCDDTDGIDGGFEDGMGATIQVTFRNLKVPQSEFIKRLLKENWKYCSEATIKEIEEGE